MAKLQWFIRRPHVIERMREHAGFSKGVDAVNIESDLRRALDEAAENQSKTFLKGCKSDQYAVRIALPKCNVVYAILKRPVDNQKTYDYIVPTVLTVDMFQAWTEDGKLGAVEDLPVEKRPLPKLKRILCLRWSNGNDRQNWEEYCVDDIPEAVRKLIAKGVHRENIKVYQEVPFKISISLDGVTS
jgi:hypothetical protein